MLKELTNAEPLVADYPFATHEPMPGMMKWEDVTVQLIDTPPIASGHHIEPYLTGFVRSADAVLLCYDGSTDDAPEQTAEVLNCWPTARPGWRRKPACRKQTFGVVLVKTLLVVTRGDDPGRRRTARPPA